MAGGGGAPADQSGEKNTYYILWVLALIGFVCGIVWYFFGDELKVFFIFLRKYQLIAISFVINLIPWKYLPWGHDLPARLASDLDLVNQISANSLSPAIAEALSNEVGTFLRFPLWILMAVLAFYVYKTDIFMRFTRKHSMKTLLSQEVDRWPQIKIVEKINLLEHDLDSGPWSMAMTPMQFAKKNKLTTVTFAEKKGSQFSKTQTPEFKVLLDKVRTERVFAAQLGRNWQGAEALLPHRKAIFAVLAARGNRDTKTSQEMVYQLARSAGEGKINLKGIDELFKKHFNAAGVQKILKAHAYEFTVFASLLMYAREDGVVASADFLWVKPIDRRLWYVINNVGRQTPAAEVAGIFCHWYNELALKRPLSVPVVGAAVDALDVALSDIIYVPDDKEREEIIKSEQEMKASQAAAAEGEETQSEGMV